MAVDARSFFASQAQRLRGAMGRRGSQYDVDNWEGFEDQYRFAKGTGKRMTEGLIRASNDELNDVVLDLLDALAPSIRGALETVWIPYFESIYEAWPVKTGNSKDKLAVVVKLAPQGVKAEIISGAPYTFFMKNHYETRFVAPDFKGRFFGYNKAGKIFFFVKEEPKLPRARYPRGTWNELVRGRFDRVKVQFVDAIGTQLAKELL
jgi:hypothetical protein